MVPLPPAQCRQAGLCPTYPRSFRAGVAGAIPTYPCPQYYRSLSGWGPSPMQKYSTQRWPPEALRGRSWLLQQGHRRASEPPRPGALRSDALGTAPPPSSPCGRSRSRTAELIDSRAFSHLTASQQAESLFRQQRRPGELQACHLCIMADFPRPPAGEAGAAGLWGQPLIVEPSPGAVHTATLILLHGFTSTPQ